MIDKLEKSRCTGCNACRSVCPRQAIKMMEDLEGFFYPIIDQSICIGCELCEKVCPSMREKWIKKGYYEPKVYAAWNRNPQIRINSTSGGVFSALAEHFILEGGYVVGAVYGRDFSIYHEICGDIKDIKRLRQSKYAQSDLKNVFIEIKTLLGKGIQVLFCGSPCQSAGLQSFLGKYYDNLYCCDFICRGIISQKVYRKYLQDEVRKDNESLQTLQFKNKDWGWNCFSTKATKGDGTIYQQDRNHDAYMVGYLKHNLYLRPVCHECRFKEIPRISDLTLGDFWGIGNYNKDLDNNQGTSVVLVNSEKGKKLYNAILDMIVSEQRDLSEVLEGNTCLLNSAPIGEYREFFFKNMERYTFGKLIRIIDEKSLHLTVRDRVFRRLYEIKNRIIEKIS